MEKISPGASTGTPHGIVKKDRAGGQKDDTSGERLEKACTDFEAIFISCMFKTMRNTIPKSGLNEFPGKDMYTAMLDQKVAEDFAKQGGIGIRDMLMRQLEMRYGSKSDED
jgi:flagellar protein FlgJ